MKEAIFHTLLRALNSARRSGRAELALEAEVEREFGASRRLAVYGSLAPGLANHDQLADVKGVWRADFFVRGKIENAAWQATGGYPIFQETDAEEWVQVALFEATELSQRWARLDSFEGPDYVRLLVPIYRDAKLSAVANIYAGVR